MLEAADGASLRTFNTLLFLCTISLILKSSGEELISYLQPITALMGDDVILPCCLNNPTDVRSKTVVWTKPGLDPVFIHVHQSGCPVYQSQHPSYRYRTTLFEDQLVNGNVSLKLSRVKISDAGTYVCSIRSMGTKASVELLVGAASTPVIDSVESDVDGGRLVLRCQSSGWYPQPELSWLDSEGHVLHAGPTETLTGPGGLYSVSSTVTVDNRGINRFICRVQQKNINQTRETHIQVSAHLITTSSHTGLWVACGVCVLLILVILYVLMKNRIPCSVGQNLPSSQSTTRTNSESSLRPNADIRKTTSENEKNKAISKPPQLPSGRFPSNNNPKPTASTSTKHPKSGSSAQNQHSEPLLPKKNAASGSSTLSKHRISSPFRDCITAQPGSSSSASTSRQSHLPQPRTRVEPSPRPDVAGPHPYDSANRFHSLRDCDDMDVDVK